jgi:outer membrane immunogenic protein
MKKLLLATAVAVAAVGTAGAADLPVKAPPMVAAAPVASWTGCYVSAGIGYGMSNTDNYNESYPGLVQTTSSGQTTGGRGWLGRGGIGCDYQVSPQFVIGAFADYDWSSIKGTYEDNFFLAGGQENLSHSWAAGGRIGYLPYPNLMTFISGGWTQAHFDGVSLASFAIPSVPPTDTFAGNTYNGWFIGGGTEYRLPWFQNLTWKTEYRFSSFQSADLPILLPSGAVSGFAEHNQNYVQSVTTSLVWRFNFGGPVVARY